MNQEYYWESLFYFYRLPHRTVSAVRKSVKFREMTQTNLSTFLFQFLHHSKKREISKISLMAAINPATLSHLRSISKILPLDPPVNHSIFRTKA